MHTDRFSTVSHIILYTTTRTKGEFGVWPVNFFSPQMSIIIPFNALYECFLIWNSFLALFFPFWHQMECRLPIFLPFSYSDAFNDERRCTLTFSFFFFFIIISPLGGWWLTSVGLVRQKRPHLLSLSLYSRRRASMSKKSTTPVHHTQQLQQHCCLSFRCFSFVPT